MSTLAAPPTTRPIPVSVKLLYGAGGLGDAIKSVASGLYLLFFYTTVLGLPGRLVGIAAGLGLLWDASCDPIVGSLSDRGRGRWGRRHGWMIVGAAGMAVSFAALFRPPTGLTQLQLFGWLLLTSLLLRTSHSMFTVPYYALGADLCPTYDGRTSIAGYRAAAVQVGAMIASAVAAALFFPAPEGPGSRFAAGSYGRMAVGLGVLIGAAGLVAAVGTWRSPLTGERPAARVRRRGRWKAVMRHRSFVVLAGAMAAFFVAMVFSAVLSIYFLTYYAAIESGRVISLCQLALYGGAIAGIGVWTRLAPTYDKRQLFFTACLLVAASLGAALWIAAPGSLSDATRVAALAAGHAAIGAAASGPAVLAPSMLADVAEEHELLSGERSDGVFFGMFSATQQVAAGVAASLAGPLVDGYAGLVPGSAVQAPDTVARLGVLACLLPGALVLVSAGVILAYDLTRHRVSLIQRQLIERTCAH